MTFDYPLNLFALTIIPCLLIRYIYIFLKYNSGINYPSIQIIKKSNKFNMSHFLDHLLFLIKILALTTLILASAKPTYIVNNLEKEFEIVDIMLLLDISDSMRVKDINNVSRFHSAKDSLKRFITRSNKNRLGLIAFGGESFTLVPLTTDKHILNLFLDELELGDLPAGTAIGMALTNACVRLKDSKSKSKVIVLLTDGENTAGSISPENGMMMAKQLNIKIHAISFSEDPFPQKAADYTGGKYFRAFSERDLNEIYKEIGEMEKTKVKLKVSKGKIDYVQPLLLMTLCLLITFIIIDNILFKRIP